MVVRGLLKFIINNNIYEKIDLIHEASKDRIEIIVDGYLFIHIINEVISKKFRKYYKNNFLFRPFVENDIVENIYYDFHILCRSLGIDLVWIITGIKDMNDRLSDSQMAKLITDSQYYKERNTKIFTKLRDGRNQVFELDEEPQKQIYFSWFNNLMKQLKRADAEILFKTDESDFLAKLYRQRRSYAILTYNPDFVIFEGCNVLLERNFVSIYGGIFNVPFIDQEMSSNILKVPKELKFCLVNSDMVRNYLRVTHDQLIAITMLKGNSYTSEHCQKLTHLIGITRHDHQDPYIGRVADYVRLKHVNTSNIENIPEINRYMAQHTDLHVSLLNCIQFYKMERDVLDKNNDDELTRYLKERVQCHGYLRICYYMHIGIFLDYIYIEELPVDGLSINDVLEEIRARIYPYLLSTRLSSVREVRSNLQKIVEVNVTHSSLKTNKINNIVVGMKIFESIWSLREPETLNYMARFGLEKGFILYLLRYLYKITKNENINLKELEFKSVFTAVLYPYASRTGLKLNTVILRESFLRMNICPSPRCVTVGTWLETICDTAYYYCAGALNLTEHFTFPYPMVNGSELYAFFASVNREDSRIDHLSQDLIMDLRHLSEEIMEIFREEYDTVIN